MRGGIAGLLPDSYYVIHSVLRVIHSVLYVIHFGCYQCYFSVEAVSYCS